MIRSRVWRFAPSRAKQEGAEVGRCRRDGRTRSLAADAGRAKGGREGEAGAALRAGLGGGYHSRSTLPVGAGRWEELGLGGGSLVAQGSAGGLRSAAVRGWGEAVGWGEAGAQAARTLPEAARYPSTGPAGAGEGGAGRGGGDPLTRFVISWLELVRAAAVAAVGEEGWERARTASEGGAW